MAGFKFMLLWFNAGIFNIHQLMCHADKLLCSQIFYPNFRGWQKMVTVDGLIKCNWLKWTAIADMLDISLGYAFVW